MGAISTPNLQLLTALASHCLLRSQHAVHSSRQQLQQLTQPLPAGFPPGPREYDLAWDLARDPLHCLESLRASYGDLVGFKLASRPIVLASSPSYAREVFITQSSTFVKAGTAFFPGSSLAGNGLLVSDGDTWKRQRRLSNPAFRKAAINSYAQAMVKVSNKMVKQKWWQGGVRDVYMDFNELTIEIVASALFGASEVSEDMVEVGAAISSAFQFFTRSATSMFIVPEWFPTMDNLQYKAAVTRLDNVVYRLIAERRSQLASSSAPAHQDLLTRLLQARDEDESGMDDQALRDELMTLLVAGQETSAILLSWSMVMLALHPHIQEHLFQEVVEVLGSQEPTHSHVSQLSYMEAFIWETLRLMPPAYIVGRCACHSTHLGEWHLPVGTTVLVSPYLLHRDPTFWPRALEFDPSRWQPGGDAKEHMENDSYWPFGGGPRNCIGMGFAMLEVSLVLVTIVKHFKISLPEGVPAPTPRAMITLRPESQVNLQLTPRQQSRGQQHQVNGRLKEQIGCT